MPEHQGSPEHTFMVMSAVPIPQSRVRMALAENHYTTPASVRIEVMEIVCAKCRRPAEDLTDPDGNVDPCVDAEDTKHLRGGPIGVRKRRTPLPPEADYRRRTCAVG